MITAYVTVLEKTRRTYKINVEDPDDAVSYYPDGEIVDEQWLTDNIENIEYEAYPPELEWEDHEERPL